MPRDLKNHFYYCRTAINNNFAIEKIDLPIRKYYHFTDFAIKSLLIAINTYEK